MHDNWDLFGLFQSFETVRLFQKDESSEGAQNYLISPQNRLAYSHRESDTSGLFLSEMMSGHDRRHVYFLVFVS